GGADCGICGLDSLIEAQLDVAQLSDLKFGACRFVVAEPANSRAEVEASYERHGIERVATKYPRITSNYYNRIGRNVEVVKLHGNIELGPVVGMARRIVDITATGTTLRENNLVIVDEVLECTARFFANPVKLRMDTRIRDLAKIFEQQASQLFETQA
ncbi:MAG: ATP phosphoribosyltransferase, partial [Eggerthellaceae bacterium]|nr:ATP phosphoribosyltransferase [Eggerthellaceae bacterium]